MVADALPSSTKTSIYRPPSSWFCFARHCSACQVYAKGMYACPVARPSAPVSKRMFSGRTLKSARKPATSSRVAYGAMNIIHHLTNFRRSSECDEKVHQVLVMNCYRSASERVTLKGSPRRRTRTSAPLASSRGITGGTRPFGSLNVRAVRWERKYRPGAAGAQNQRGSRKTNVNILSSERCRSTNMLILN